MLAGPFKQTEASSHGLSLKYSLNCLDISERLTQIQKSVGLVRHCGKKLLKIQ